MWTKGRGHSSEAAMKVLKYIPRARTPWQPSTFRRANLTLEDLSKMWGMGRAKYGAGHYNSGYSTLKQHVVDDVNVDLIPKHELEKYMPNIHLGPKALVTPVSVMSARAGHRITHDLIHSYDAHIGGVEKPAAIDHDNISPLDPTHAGLHGNALDCRGRIFRWLRRGPFFNEDQYFRRYVTSENMNSEAKEVEVPQEVSLHKKILRLCKQGDLKSACEVYRKLTHPPPVQVYRALTAACVPHGQIADAVAIFEEGNAKLFYIARDGEVLLNVMNAAIAAKNRSRVMWTLNVARGLYYENQLVRAEVDSMYMYRISAAAMTFFLDHSCGEEARSVYLAMEQDGLLQYDVFIKVGQQMQEMLAKGDALPAFNESSMVAGCSLQLNAVNFAPLIADRVLRSLPANRQLLHQKSSGSSQLPRMVDEKPDAALAWLKRSFADVDVLFIVRLARFEHGKDLMALDDQSAFISRCCTWLDCISARHDDVEGPSLPYLRKSKPSATVEANIRVAWLPERRKKMRMLPGELGFRFHYSPTTRFVDEVFPTLPPGETSFKAKYLALEPTHTEVSCAVTFEDEKKQLKESTTGARLQGGGPARQAALPSRILHPSLFAASASSTGGASSAAPTQRLATATPAF